MTTWQKIHSDSDRRVDRMAVPGGWIYREAAENAFGHVIDCQPRLCPRAKGAAERIGCGRRSASNFAGQKEDQQVVYTPSGCRRQPQGGVMKRKQIDPLEHIRAGVEYANVIRAERVIVICDAEHRYAWLRGIYQWTTMRDPFAYAIQSGRYGTSDCANWTVISYELARNPAILRGLVKQHFDLLLTTSTLQHLVLEKLSALVDVCRAGLMLCDRITNESVMPPAVEPEAW